MSTQKIKDRIRDIIYQNGGFPDRYIFQLVQAGKEFNISENDIRNKLIPEVIQSLDSNEVEGEIEFRKSLKKLFEQLNFSASQIKELRSLFTLNSDRVNLIEETELQTLADSKRKAMLEFNDFLDENLDKVMLTSLPFLKEAEKLNVPQYFAKELLDKARKKYQENKPVNDIVEKKKTIHPQIENIKIQPVKEKEFIAPKQENHKKTINESEEKKTKYSEKKTINKKPVPQDLKNEIIKLAKEGFISKEEFQSLFINAKENRIDQKQLASFIYLEVIMPNQFQAHNPLTKEGSSLIDKLKVSDWSQNKKRLPKKRFRLSYSKPELEKEIPKKESLFKPIKQTEIHPQKTKTPKSTQSQNQNKPPEKIKEKQETKIDLNPEKKKKGKWIAFFSILFLIAATTGYWQFFLNGHPFWKTNHNQIETTSNKKITIVGNKVNLREEPNTQKNVIRQFNEGQAVTLLEKGQQETIKECTDFWYKVQSENQIGWVFGKFTSESISTDCKTSGLLYVIPENKNPVILYKKPDIQSNVIKKYMGNTKLRFVNKGDVQYIKGCKDYWYQIDQNGTKGWIFGHFTSLSISDECTIEKAIVKPTPPPQKSKQDPPDGPIVSCKDLKSEAYAKEKRLKQTRSEFDKNLAIAAWQKWGNCGNGLNQSRANGIINHIRKNY